MKKLERKTSFRHSVNTRVFITHQNELGIAKNKSWTNNLHKLASLSWHCLDALQCVAVEAQDRQRDASQAVCKWYSLNADKSYRNKIHRI
jgi:hypothetical protein